MTHSHFATGRQQSYFGQLLGEVLVTTCSKGQPVREWRSKKSVRHEALDARVYAYAALRALVSMGLVLDRRSRPDGGPRRTTASPAASQPQPLAGKLKVPAKPWHLAPQPRRQSAAGAGTG